MHRSNRRKKKNKKLLKFISVLAVILIALVGCALLEPQREETPNVKTDTQNNSGDTTEEDNTNKHEKQPDTNNTSQTTKSDYNNNQQAPTKPKYIKGILVVNKKIPLPADYNPGVSPEAQQALDKMLVAAADKGFNLTAFSAFRSYDYQQQLYTKYVNRDGQQAADRYSARPGHSEHQTGLAFDIGEVGREDLWLTEAFGETAAGQWLQNNAHKYGFILRYPKGKESITGFMHESWHFRYVGEKDAKKIYDTNITLEEYLEIQ